MEIEVRTLHIGKSSWVHDLVEQYEKKIKFFNPIASKFIKNEKDFLKGVEGRDLVFILDEKGSSPDSFQFASNLQQAFESGKRKLVLIIGGPFGIPEEAKNRADKKIRLSNLVFNQEIALAVLYEQIFRGLAINNNHPYHND